MDAERLVFGELRADIDRREVSGVVVRYGSEAHIGNLIEKFASGSMKIEPDIALNVQHDRTQPVARTGAGLEVTDDGAQVTFTATLAPGRRQDQLLADVQAKLLRGASAEFIPVADSVSGNVRTITDAKLAGLAIVDTPAYPDSSIALRSAMIKVPKPRMRFQI